MALLKEKPSGSSKALTVLMTVRVSADLKNLLSQEADRINTPLSPFINGVLSSWLENQKTSPSHLPVKKPKDVNLSEIFTFLSALSQVSNKLSNLTAAVYDCQRSKRIVNGLKLAESLNSLERRMGELNHKLDSKDD